MYGLHFATCHVRGKTWSLAAQKMTKFRSVRWPLSKPLSARAKACISTKRLVWTCVPAQCKVVRFRVCKLQVLSRAVRRSGNDGHNVPCASGSMQLTRCARFTPLDVFVWRCGDVRHSPRAGLRKHRDERDQVSTQTCANFVSGRHVKCTSHTMHMLGGGSRGW
jgi:hypothetical protein